MTIDELQIVFSQKGAAGVLSQISKISAAIDNFVKKHSKGSADVLKKYEQTLKAVEKKQESGFKNIEKRAQESNKNILSLYDSEIDKLEKLKKAREEAYGVSGGASAAGGLEGGAKGKGALGLLLTTLYLPRALNNANQKIEEIRQLTFRRQNQEMLSGSSSAKRAVGYDNALEAYGAVRGEGLESLRSFSARLGAATRGDVSLLQSLGKWGVSGVSPHDDPMDIVKKIAARSKELSANERNAFFAEVGFTDAQASAALKGDFSIFNKSGMLTEVSGASRNATETFATTVQETVAHLDKMNQSLGIASNWYNKLIQQFPETYNWVNAITGILPDIASALSGIAAMKTLFGGGGNGGGMVKTNKPKNTAIPPASNSKTRTKLSRNLKSSGFRLGSSMFFIPNLLEDEFFEEQRNSILNSIDKKQRIQDLEREAVYIKNMMKKGKISPEYVDAFNKEINSLGNPIPPIETKSVRIDNVNISVDSGNAAEEISEKLLELANSQ